MSQSRTWILTTFTELLTNPRTHASNDVAICHPINTSDGFTRLQLLNFFQMEIISIRWVKKLVMDIEVNEGDLNFRQVYAQTVLNITHL